MCRIFYTFLKNICDLSSKEQRRISSDTAYLLLYKCARICGYDITDMDIIRSEKGKPYIRKGSFYFSISHADELVCVAISDREIGIDVQRIGDVSEQVINRFLKKNIGDNIENTYLWTDYEAIGKYFGVGIPHLIEPDESLSITRYKCADFAVSLCHETDDDCVSLEEIISVKD